MRFFQPMNSFIGFLEVLGDMMIYKHSSTSCKRTGLSCGALVFGLLLLVACGGAAKPSDSNLTPTSAIMTESTALAEPVQVEIPQGFNNPTPQEADPITPEDRLDITPNGIIIDLAAPERPFDKRLLGSNVPAWLNSQIVENESFLARTQAAGITLLRIPGGSWSNYYEWLPCEQEGICPWDWGVLRPTDFINLIYNSGLEAMYTINMNGTAQEAAALVAFFNGSVEDDSVIGVDVLGRDWGQVNQWAALRTANGNPDPVDLRYWEIGNEVYAGKPGMGAECDFEWGWEDVWTCDGAEYVAGIGSGENRKDGFLDYVAAMKAVDPTILIGAVGVDAQDAWSDWGHEVLAGAGEAMDFYVIHHYGFFDPPATYEAVLALPQAVWEPLAAGVAAATETEVPIAITEYNLFSFQDADNEQWMTRAVNMLYLADTLGQMATHGIAIANQWNLTNGPAANGTDYGMMNVDTFAPNPQYYAFLLWAQFGSELLPVTSPFAADTSLSVYAGRDEQGVVSLLAINKTGAPLTSEVAFLNAPADFLSVEVNVVQAESLDSQQVTLNGVANPDDDLANAPPTILPGGAAPFSHTFAPYSITLLRFLTSNGRLP